MTIAWRLRAVTAALVAILACAVAVHLHTVRRSVDAGRAIAALSERHRHGVTEQVVRVADIDATARKYAVTRDRRYLDRLAIIAGELATAARTDYPGIESPAEQAARGRLERDWSRIEPAIRVLAAGGLPDSAAVSRSRTLPASLDAIRADLATLDRASGTALTQLQDSASRSVALAERVSWLVLGAGLALLALLSLAVGRWIVLPLRRLADRTREIAQGRFTTVEVAGDDEMARVTRDFNAMSARLAEVDALKRDFLSNVSHDLKTPLSSMRETTDALLDGLAGPLSDKQRQLLVMNQDSGSRLSAMIAKLLDLSRAEARATVDHDLLDLRALVRRAVEHMNAGRAHRVEAVRATLAGGNQHIFIRADAEGIAQVLDNLLENAGKFSPAGGTVTVSVDERDGWAHLVVADEGPGVPLADRDRIFDRFYQTVAGRSTRSRGIGLGLAICRQIVESHRGTIRVTDNRPTGARFEVALPGAIGIRETTPRDMALVGAGA